METSPPAPLHTPPWLLLIHQLPAKPAYFRVKVWRRLQTIGAVAVKNSVYALPGGEQAQEDFQWIANEIAEGGGEAMVCEARLIHGVTDPQVRALFDQARDADYQVLLPELRALAEKLTAEALSDPERRREARNQIKRLRRPFDQIAAIDFFGANGREPVEGLLAALEERVREPSPPSPPAAPPSHTTAPLGRVWVTRQGVQVDRIASAWLIRRFIDPDAIFKFVAPKGYAPEPGELRFDMFEAEHTHEGDLCTFEVLLDRFGPTDPALRPALTALAEIIHDIDLKESKFGREETAGLSHLLAGIALAHDDDDERLRRGDAVLDDLLEYFRRRRD